MANSPVRVAIIATIYRYLSHAQHMGDRFLIGYPFEGKWHKPDVKVVSLYVDQKPEGDQSAVSQAGEDDNGGLVERERAHLTARRSLARRSETDPRAHWPTVARPTGFWIHYTTSLLGQGAFPGPRWAAARRRATVAPRSFDSRCRPTGVADNVSSSG